jgi:hypothetical protein
MGLPPARSKRAVYTVPPYRQCHHSSPEPSQPWDRLAALELPKDHDLYVPVCILVAIAHMTNGMPHATGNLHT